MSARQLTVPEITCNGCGTVERAWPGTPPFALRQALDQDGWKVDAPHDQDLCPRCAGRPQRPLPQQDVVDWARREIRTFTICGEQEGLRLSPNSCTELAGWLRKLLALVPGIPGPEHDCTHCGTDLDTCDQLLRRNGRPCCDRCFLTDTHKDLTTGYAARMRARLPKEPK